MLINYLLFIMKSYTEYTQKTHKTEKNPNQSKQTCLQTRLNQLAAKKLTSHFYFLIKYIYCLCCAKGNVYMLQKTSYAVSKCRIAIF